MKKLQILQGDSYGSWTIVKETNKVGRYRHFICECKCGAIKSIRLSALIAGTSKQCRHCYSVDQQVLETKHANPLYQVFANMKQRCKGTHSGSKSYLSNGIQVCIEWNKFETFESWAIDLNYFPGAILHRKNDLENYYPDNCEFLTKSDHAKIHGLGL